MLASALFGVFLIPLLYIVFQWLREKVRGHRAIGFRQHAEAKHAGAEAA